MNQKKVLAPNFELGRFLMLLQDTVFFEGKRMSNKRICSLASIGSGTYGKVKRAKV